MRAGTSFVLAAAIVALFTGAAGGARPKPSDQSTPRATWVTDGAVDAIADTGTTTYIGGTFTHVGPRTGPAAAFDATTGVAATIAQVSGGNSTVYAVAADGSGGVFVGGDFTHVGGLARHDLAHIASNGSVDSSFAPEPDGVVRALALGSGVLYVGGDFQDIGGKNHPFLAAVNVTDGSATSFNPVPNDVVRALALDGTTLYAGGDFGFIGQPGHARAHAAAVDTTGFGVDTSWNPGPDGSVYSLLISGSTVYLGGNFLNAGGASRPHLAAVDETAGTATSFAPADAPDNRPYALAMWGTTLYAGGLFLHCGTYLQNGLAAFDTTGTGSLVNTWHPKDYPSAVSALATANHTLYVGGTFSSTDGQTRNNIAAFDVTNGPGELDNWDPDVNNQVLALAVSDDGNTIYAGGIFSSGNIELRSSIAAIDDATGHATSWDPEALGGAVRSLAVYGSTVYAGGAFTSIGDTNHAYLAALKASNGDGTTWAPAPNGEVDAVAVSADGSTVYAGGAFTTIGADSQSRNYLGAVKASDASATLWDPEPNGQVDALAVSGSVIYAGGQFTLPANHLIGLDDTDGAVTGDFLPNVDGDVDAIAVSGSTVYAGGAFGTIGGQSRPYLGAMDASNGNATPWKPAPNDVVTSLAVNGSTVFAGGDFTSIGGQTRHYLAGLDSSGNATSFDPQPNYLVAALASAGSHLDVGGSFTGFETGASQGFASFALPVTLTVTRTGTGPGTVTSVPAGITCGATCVQSFDGGTFVTLTATPGSNTTFDGWSGGGCSGTGDCELTLGVDTKVTAKFTHHPAPSPPSVFSLSPAQGPPGAAVTIGGAAFNNVTSVTFNGVPAVFTVLNPSKIATHVPVSATTGKVTVTTLGGTAQSGVFTVLAASSAVPSVTGFLPASAHPGATVLIHGSGFTGATAVRFNGHAANLFTVLGDGLIKARVPAAATTGPVSVTTPGGTGASAGSFTVL